MGGKHLQQAQLVMMAACAPESDLKVAAFLELQIVTSINLIPTLKDSSCAMREGRKDFLLFLPNASALPRAQLLQKNHSQPTLLRRIDELSKPVNKIKTNLITKSI